MKKLKERSRRPSKQVGGARGKQLSEEERAPRPALGAPEGPLFPVVGIGASAGGLEAFTQLLRNLPCDSGMAFVLIQHLDPTHRSFLAEALAKATRMRVIQADDGTSVEPDHVYVIPPNADIGLVNGRIELVPRDSDSRKPHLPIDFFLTGLASSRGHHAIGVILSGNASDGTEGLRAIKAADGMTFAQSPTSAKYGGMPHSAVDAGVVDYCLQIPEIAAALVQLSRSPYLRARGTDASDEEAAETLDKIFDVVRTRVGVDFSEYKLPTFERRLARRMALVNVTTRQEYVALLKQDAEEARRLFEDSLIHVSSFFRDPEAFEELKKLVFPAILEHKPDGAAIRIWVAGCSTGEEVYSLAIALLELLEQSPRRVAVQIFGSDISDAAIEKARAGVYSDSAVRDLSEQRRRRYFVRIERGYRVEKSVRDMCVFVRHDLARDPPFCKLDIASCRNVLIYFGAALHKRAIATFHYCLNEPGFLFLGHTESISGQSRLFSAVGGKSKIFRRTGAPSTLRFPYTPKVFPAKSAITVGLPSDRPIHGGVDVGKHIDRLLLSMYAPPGVVVGENMQIIQFRGRTGPYLEPAPGDPQNNVLHMARGGLLSVVRAALAEAKKHKIPVRKEGGVFERDGSTRACDVVVIPVTGLPEKSESLFLVLFDDVERPAATGKKVARRTAPQAGSAAEARQRLQVEHELAATKVYLQSLLEVHGRIDDDLATANDDLVTGNEELQSMNEELETAKEELQSANEELTTVNDELQCRNEELNQANGDLINLVSMVDIPIIILDAERNIRRFTPKARTIMRVLPADVGRPIDDIKLNIIVADLDQQIAEVIETITVKESEVQDRQGRWYRMQIRPYRTTDNKIDGAILSLVDIDRLKVVIREAEWARDYAAGIVEAVQVPLVVLDGEICVISANEAFYKAFGASALGSEKGNRSLFSIGRGEWDLPELRAALEETRDKNTPFQGLDVAFDSLPAGKRVMTLSARSFQARSGAPLILLAIEDITSRRRAEDERAELLAQAQRARNESELANSAKDQFLATLSHELRTPLSTMVMYAQLLRRGNLDEVRMKRACDAIERSTKTQTQLIDDLLDVSRITSGKLKIELQEVEMAAVARAAIESVSALAERKSVAIDVTLGKQSAVVSGDPMRLQQVLWNLLANAIKFTPEGGRVGVAIDAEAPRVRIRVSDTGKGIEPGFLPYVWNRFAQEDSSKTREYGGMGLGLAIVRHIVESHGGTVRAESPGKEMGATFSVFLPLLTGASAQSELGGSNQGPPSLRTDKYRGQPRLKMQRILVVDDDVDARQGVAEMLGETGATVRAVASAAEAMTAIQDFNPQVLVCDIAMPFEDGYSFIHRVRALSPAQGGRIPAIALTALAGEEDRRQAFAAGYQMHLPKPVDIGRLTDAVLEQVEPAKKAPLAPP